MSTLHLSHVLHAHLIQYILLLLVYNLTFHPLAKYPGPILWRCTRLKYLISGWKGYLHTDVMAMHKRYGSVVRIAPNELSFCDPAAWEDIYSNRGGALAFPKSRVIFSSLPGRADSIVTTIDDKLHARMKKKMDMGFTDSAVARQEDLVQKHVSKLVSKLRDKVQYSLDGEAIVNVVKWMVFVTLDIVTDLSFGESFHSLDNADVGEWGGVVFNSIRAQWCVALLRHYTWITWALNRLIPRSAKEKAEWIWSVVEEKVDRRLARMTDRPDFLDLWQRQGKGKEGLGDGQIYSNAVVMVVAGTETSSAILTGALCHLVNSPETLNMLTRELRTQFAQEDQMTFAAVKRLPYLNAVVKEVFRMCNPNPFGLPRITPPQGGTVCGNVLPGNVFVSIHAQALSMDDTRFHKATAFYPERWLPEVVADPSSPFRSDDRSSVQVFSIGPRSCIGQRLAMAEVTLTLAKLVWNFDFCRANTEAGELVWEEQRAFPVIEKKPFEVKISLKKS
ncbi:cytochrome P450 [Lophiostoma macrostomum CBS 122681]|uniref:Cytochrome P450 n=1 Tax=Lophiostoma macrostomum CBS 122681 TaxID=1314788 RepID=A0A6A6SP27_9PLEO|nr:cytochrome P450 [Lophiostoma macrostomum CBS 122681]